MMRVVLLICIFSVFCTAQLRLKLGVNTPKNSPAYNAINDYWQAISRYTEDIYEIVPMNPESEFNAVNIGSIDGGSTQGLTFINRDSNFIVIDEPLVKLSIAVIGKLPSTIQHWADLSQKKAVILEGAYSIKHQLKKNAIKAIPLEQHSDLIKSVCLGHADVAIVESAYIPQLMDAIAQCPTLSVHTKNIDSIINYSYLHKKYAHKVIDIKRAMIMVKESGKYQKIIKEHFDHLFNATL
ncbi:MAG: transporter substrate-binding domain-containing protein [Fibrobacterales bacterium]